MLNTTLPFLKCPRQKRKSPQCAGELKLTSPSNSTEKVYDVLTGTLQCRVCHSKFPILAGVAVLVSSVDQYLQEHVKGIAQIVPDSEIPKEFLRGFLLAKSEIQTEHIEEDLEAERLVSLYVLNHYLRVSEGGGGTQSNLTQKKWWKAKSGESSPFIDEIIKQYWDQGPFSQIEKWMAREHRADRIPKNVVELGCGVGGLFPAIKAHIGSYLGVDSSFLSVAVARHLALGAPLSGKLRYPEDLIQGPVSAEFKLPSPPKADGRADYIVGNLDVLPLQSGKWDVSIALNAIDMLDDPACLPRLQFDLIQEVGLAIQSCPYIWHPGIAQKLRKKVPGDLRISSSRAIEWLYQQNGFKIEQSVEHIPWVFYKHLRQLEVYSVHSFVGKKDLRLRR